jgi:uncharacterized protein YqjF (DUF2071 family)
LTVQTHDGSAWIGLVPFVMRVSAAKGPVWPWAGIFPETNVRTYVTAADGSTGIWFFSLDAARLGAVVVARTGYQLPYFWSSMKVIQAGPIVTYESRRRWPGPRSATSCIAIEVGDPVATEAVPVVDQFLTARFRLYSRHPQGLSYAHADHPPWRLRGARLLHLDERLLTAAGLPAPAGDPRVAFSDGVHVRIGWPHRLGNERRPETSAQ